MDESVIDPLGTCGVIIGIMSSAVLEVEFERLIDSIALFNALISDCISDNVLPLLFFSVAFVVVEVTRYVQVRRYSLYPDCLVQWIKPPLFGRMPKLLSLSGT